MSTNLDRLVGDVYNNRTPARGSCTRPPDVDVSDIVHRPGCGRLNDKVREAVALAARHEALLLDTVYTGKPMAALVAHVRAGRITAGSRVLLVRTGGLQAIFDADRLGPCLSEAPWAPSVAALASFQDPLSECLYLGPLPGGGRGDEAAAFGRLGLMVVDEDQRPALQLARDGHSAADGGADPVEVSVVPARLASRKRIWIECWGDEGTMGGMAHGSLASGDRLDGEVGYGLPEGSRFVGAPRVAMRRRSSGTVRFPDLLPGVRHLISIPTRRRRTGRSWPCSLPGMRHLISIPTETIGGSLTISKSIDYPREPLDGETALAHPIDGFPGARRRVQEPPPGRATDLQDPAWADWCVVGPFNADV